MVDRSNLSRETILRILERGRWAPSGDNTQPWRFEILGADQVVVHGHDTRDEILYDFDGHASHMAHGALLETMRIAASAEGLTMSWQVDSDVDWRKIEYRVKFFDAPDLGADPLGPFIEMRTVQRRPMRLTPLTDKQRQAIIAAPGEAFEVQLFERFSERKRIAGLLWDNAHIRLTCPEAFPVHQSIIEWGAQFSKDRIPEQAVGVDPVTAKLMRWVMHSWQRVDFFNRYLMGTIAPRVQLDYLPALMCAAHLLIKPRVAPSRLEDWVALGGAMQRVWLTVSRLGLHLQPEMTPVIFRWYSQADRVFSNNMIFKEKSSKLSRQFEVIADVDPFQPFGFFCRIGRSEVPRSRSLRRALADLIGR